MIDPNSYARAIDNAERLARDLAEATRKGESLCEQNGALLMALREAVDVVEGRPRRSPFVAVEEWKKLLRVTDDSRKESK